MKHCTTIITIDAFYVDSTVTTGIIVSLVYCRVTTYFKFIENNNHNKLIGKSLIVAQIKMNLYRYTRLIYNCVYAMTHEPVADLSLISNGHGTPISSTNPQES